MSGSDNKNQGKDIPAATAETAISSPDARIGARVDSGHTKTLQEDRLDPMVGRTIADRYQVLKILGRGGMGTVYVAEHIQLKKRVALKVLSEELNKQSELVTRFLKEARAAAQIGHPNIVDVFDLDELPEGGAFIAMALLEGHDLQAEIERGPAMSPARARSIVGEICRALAAAHSKGIVHRDMKPANVFLSRDADGREQVKVLDFGIAQIQEASGDEARLTQTGAIVGTPAFMSPEQARGERPDHRADIYSVGCILFNLLTGETLFTSTTLMGVLTKHLFEQPQPPSLRRPEAGISPELDAMVLRALAKDPNDRFQTMKEMWTALEAGISTSPQPWMDSSSGRFMKIAPPTPVPTPSGAATAVTEYASSGITAPPKKSKLGAVLFGIVALLAVCGGVAFVAFRRASVVPVATTPAPVTTPNTAPAAQAPTPPPATEVTLEVHSTPAGAVVWQGDKQLGATPMRLVRPRSNDSLALRLTIDDYNEESLSLTLDRDRLVDVHLRPAEHATKTAGTTHAKGSEPEHADRRIDSPTAKATSVKKAGRKGDLKDPFAQ